MGKKPVTIEATNLKRRSKNYLYRFAKMNPDTPIIELANFTRQEIMRWSGVGEMTIDEYIKELSKHGRRLKRKE